MEQMGRIHRALGLTVGIVKKDSDTEERQMAYQQDITYCTCQVTPLTIEHHEQLHWKVIVAVNISI
eukprot:9334772-Pyramimonas_sp.AAC.2